MQINVTGHQVEVSQSLQKSSKERLVKLVEKYFPDPIDAAIVFEKRKSFFKTEIKLHESTQKFIVSTAEDLDIIKSFDKCLGKVESALRKEKSKLKAQHHKS